MRCVDRSAHAAAARRRARGDGDRGCVAARHGSRAVAARARAERFAAPCTCTRRRATQALDFFILYSSATTLFGNPGQGAYVAANMALEALAAERRARELPVTCIGWGPIADAGYLARNERILEALVGRMGGAPLKSDDALLALESLLGSPAGNVGLLDLDWAVLGRSLPASRGAEILRSGALGRRRARCPWHRVGAGAASAARLAQRQCVGRSIDRNRTRRGG